MRDDHDGMMLVRADLCDLVEQMQNAMEQLAARDFCRHAKSIRTMAAAYGLTPVVSVADALERAVMAQPRGCNAGVYFDRLRDAIGCDRVDEAAGEAMLASVSVRLGH